MAFYEITTEEAPLDFEVTMESDMLERTLRNAKNLMMCRKGEVPYDRHRGLDPAIFDMPFGEADAVIVPELDRCLLYEPDVEVEDGWIETNENGESVVHCIVEINLDEDE